jgi:hypothetical protein
MLIPNVLELDYTCQSQDTEQLDTSILGCRRKPILHVNFDIELQMSTRRHGMMRNNNPVITECFHMSIRMGTR